MAYLKQAWTACKIEALMRGPICSFILWAGVSTFTNLFCLFVNPIQGHHGHIVPEESFLAITQPFLNGLSSNFP